MSVYNFIQLKLLSTKINARSTLRVRVCQTHWMQSCIKIIEFNMNTKTLHEPLYVMDFIISDVRKLTKIFLNSTTSHININSNNNSSRNMLGILLAAVILHSIVLTNKMASVSLWPRVYCLFISNLCEILYPFKWGKRRCTDIATWNSMART